MTFWLYLLSLFQFQYESPLQTLYKLNFYIVNIVRITIFCKLNANQESMYENECLWIQLHITWIEVQSERNKQRKRLSCLSIVKCENRCHFIWLLWVSALIFFPNYNCSPTLCWKISPTPKKSSQKKSSTFSSNLKHSAFYMSLFFSFFPILYIRLTKL